MLEAKKAKEETGVEKEAMEEECKNDNTQSIILPPPNHFHMSPFRC